MAEKDGRVQGFSQPPRPDPSSAAAASPLPLRRVDILRARDIIPGAGRSSGGDEGVNRVDIPRFDLAEDIMAEQRRLIGIRRKGPGGPAPIPVTTPQLPSDLPPASRCSDDGGAFEGIGTGWDPIIADIVARDIERLCAGGSWT